MTTNALPSALAQEWLTTSVKHCGRHRQPTRNSRHQAKKSVFRPISSRAGGGAEFFLPFVSKSPECRHLHRNLLFTLQILNSTRPALQERRSRVTFARLQLRWEGKVKKIVGSDWITNPPRLAPITASRASAIATRTLAILLCGALLCGGLSAEQREQEAPQLNG